MCVFLCVSQIHSLSVLFVHNPYTHTLTLTHTHTHTHNTHTQPHTVTHTHTHTDCSQVSVLCSFSSAVNLPSATHFENHTGELGEKSIQSQKLSLINCFI